MNFGPWRIVTVKHLEEGGQLMSDMIAAATAKSRLLGQCFTAMREALAYIKRMPPHRPISLTNQPLTEAEREWRDLLIKLETLLLREKK